MSRKKGGNVIGFDPLAWMKQSDADGESADAPVAPVDASPSPAVPTQPDPVPVVAASASAAAEIAVSLGDEVTIAQAANLYQTLANQIMNPTLVVEAGSVRRVDAAGLQLLLAFARERDRRGAALRWRGVSGPLREAAGRLGLEQALHLHAA